MYLGRVGPGPLKSSHNVPWAEKQKLELGKILKDSARNYFLNHEPGPVDCSTTAYSDKPTSPCSHGMRYLNWPGWQSSVEAYQPNIPRVSRCTFRSILLPNIFHNSLALPMLCVRWTLHAWALAGGRASFDLMVNNSRVYVLRWPWQRWWRSTAASGGDTCTLPQACLGRKLKNILRKL